MSSYVLLASCYVRDHWHFKSRAWDELLSFSTDGYVLSAVHQSVFWWGHSECDSWLTYKREPVNFFKRGTFLFSVYLICSIEALRWVRVQERSALLLSITWSLKMWFLSFLSVWNAPELPSQIEWQVVPVFSVVSGCRLVLVPEEQFRALVLKCCTETRFGADIPVQWRKPEYRCNGAAQIWAEDPVP